MDPRVWVSFLVMRGFGCELAEDSQDSTHIYAVMGTMVIQPYKGIPENMVECASVVLRHEENGLLLYSNFYFHWPRAAAEHWFLALLACVNIRQGPPSHTGTSIYLSRKSVEGKSPGEGGQAQLLTKGSFKDKRKEHNCDDVRQTSLLPPRL
jgi:hypothetical protein